MVSSPVVKQVERFDVTGFSVKTQNKDEFNTNTAQLPNLWQQFYASDLGSNTCVYGVYSHYDSDASGFYQVTAGVKSFHPAAGLSTVTVQEGSYLVFQGSGPIPAAVVDTWKKIWEFFATHAEFQRNFISDFELYSGFNQVAIYIGLK
ncbi:GyrI-like domain-containing protein [Legionella worsleiensis]|uniref:Transcription activator n=1 Tax=Legionella worsleiensis TaxID=45076 RepID=A0A0W1AAH1_9GAMM|nr:effector binding domain-containing protein [Legionella worsleiensis]KTD78299.1 transcription activator [Legionella worsleiensis]STY32636.1 Transcription activator, effector binding [Legionella worsleiensis]